MEVVVFEEGTLYTTHIVESAEDFVGLCREYIPPDSPIELAYGKFFVSCGDSSGCHKAMTLVLVGILTDDMVSRIKNNVLAGQVSPRAFHT
jgi:hypothetical protein